jgi:hypothetical protein
MCVRHRRHFHRLLQRRYLSDDRVRNKHQCCYLSIFTLLSLFWNEKKMWGITFWATYILYTSKVLCFWRSSVTSDASSIHENTCLRLGYVFWISALTWRTSTTSKMLNQHSNSVVFKSGGNRRQTRNVPCNRCRRNGPCGWRPMELLNFVSENFCGNCFVNRLAAFSSLQLGNQNSSARVCCQTFQYSHNGITPTHN